MMIKRLLTNYLDAFSGLSRDIWLLALVTLINRAGTMVIPFLTLYLTTDMGLDLEQVGWIMSCFGAGSVVGSWIGGKLTDRIGFYRTMIISLVLSGIFFVLLQFFTTFQSFCVGVFVLSLIADSFRPAIFVAMREYAGKENRTRGVTLIRLAINLGFSAGPAVGGWIIITMGYAGLFWIDGVTCLLAAGVLLMALGPVSMGSEENEDGAVGQRSPYRDGPYLVFLLAVVFISIPFLQYFSTMPLFYRDVHGLDEATIGLLFGFNGLVIFVLEMPLIKYCQEKNYELFRLLVFSVVLITMSFLVINIFPTVAFLWVGMFLVTVGEMINFPFTNQFAYDRSDKGPAGAYMALFTISWSIAHVIGHNLGLRSVAKWGYELSWYLFAACTAMAVLLLLLVKWMVQKESA